MGLTPSAFSDGTVFASILPCLLCLFANPFMFYFIYVFGVWSFYLIPDILFLGGFHVCFGVLFLTVYCYAVLSAPGRMCLIVF